MYSNRLQLHEVRLLYVDQNSWAADISCDIRTVSLSTQPTFAALSYVWGTQTIAQTSIRIGGQLVSIGRSLDTALRYYRRASWQMPLWVDALCINQNDIAERSAQVSFMDSIYSSAAAVFAFLGSGIDLMDDDYEARVLSMEASSFRIYNHHQNQSETVSNMGLTDQTWSTAPSLSRPDQEASVLFDFLKGACSLKINDHLSKVPLWGRRLEADSPEYPWETLVATLDNFNQAAWWSRVWTIQESVVGKEPVIFFRTVAAPWGLILEAVNTLHAHVNDCCTPYLRNDAPPGYASAVLRLIRQAEQVQKTRRMYSEMHDPKNTRADGGDKGGELSSMLLEYMHVYHPRSATDRRDKVYSLLPLLKLDPKAMLIYPDYGESVEKVYIKTARTIIQHSCSLDILAIAGALPSNALPSWCPDWSIEDGYPESASQIRALQSYYTGMATTCKISFFDDDVGRMDVEGLILDSIDALGGTEFSGKDLWELLFGWMQFVQAHAPETKWLDFCRTARADVWIASNHLSFYRMGGSLRRDTNHEICWVDPATHKLRDDLPPQDITETSLGSMKTRFKEWDCIAGTQAMRTRRGGIAPNPPMEEQLRTSTAHRQFAKFSECQIGLVPEAALVGDCVAVFRGCRFPCLLRPENPLPARPRRAYRVVGSAYIHGQMDGEMQGRLGDLPWDMITLC
ncbi:heterokaryon incompatibility protein-domain-containing protein [Lasiosphaeris hirsuta]|uniref:Heterokaryon incompatibility protein-domain-containing protein n=1 Tax=Lasiosphaeris hirsuta TaxID=260670 RepID=A0AA39ZRI4_9PEZI|nr:heterokaryon incompatibility protein-domain-containing protein [Lasiosphaeris hirsuta]